MSIGEDAKIKVYSVIKGKLEEKEEAIIMSNKWVYSEFNSDSGKSNTKKSDMNKKQQ